MKTSTRGLLALIKHEGVVLSAYRDSTGVWTIGVGHTAAAGAPNPKPGLQITLERAVGLFRQGIRKYEAGVNQAVKVPLKQHEFDALVSFHFNTGAIARAAITRHLNAGDRQKAAAAFMNWTMAGGKRGVLADRRSAERTMFARGDYGNIASVLVYDRYPGPARTVSTAGLLGNSLIAAPPKSSHPSAPVRSVGPGRYQRAILAALAVAGAAAAAFFLGA